MPRPRPDMAQIAILFHEHDSAGYYLVHQLADVWKADGHDVEYRFGPGGRITADVVLLHVNLSVVPEAYISRARESAVALNLRVHDIRKSSYSEHLVAPGDSWPGPVIVKSNLNFGGLPETRLTEAGKPLLARAGRSIAGLLRPSARPQRLPTYDVFDNQSEIPLSWYERPDIVIEKFLPEFEQGKYHVRTALILGKRRICHRISGDTQILKGGSKCTKVRIEPDPILEEWRARFCLDFGKLDYVVHEGEPVLLDVNKTIGCSVDKNLSEQLRQERRLLAEGLYDYLEDQADVTALP